MGKGRRRQPQQPVEVYLPGGGGQQIRSPDHLGDPHPGVIHHHRQLIGKDAVGPPEIKVPAAGEQVFPVLPHAQVVEGHFLIGNLHPPGGGLGAALFGNLGGGQIPAGAGIHHVPVRGVGRAGGMELGPGAKAGIHQPHLLQLVITLQIDGGAFALIIGAVGATVRAALIPHQAQPPEILLQLVGIDPGAAGSVQILNPQDNPPALALGGQPGQQAAGQISQMQPPAGAGGKPPDRAAHRPSFQTPSAGWKIGVL